MPKPTAEQLSDRHECNPYLIEAGEIARFDWKDMNADLAKVGEVRAHIQKACELIRGMSDSLDDASKESAASALEDCVHDMMDGDLFYMVEKYAKEASEEMWSDA